MQPIVEHCLSCLHTCMLNAIQCEIICKKTISKKYHDNSEQDRQ